MKTILLNDSHYKRFMFFFAVAMRFTEKSKTVAEIERLKQQKTITILKHTLKVKVEKYKLVMQRIVKIRIALRKEPTHKLKRQLEMLMTLKRSTFFEIKELSSKLKAMGVRVSLSFSTFENREKQTEMIHKLREELVTKMRILKQIRRQIHKVYVLYMQMPTEELKLKLHNLKVQRRRLSIFIRMRIQQLQRLGFSVNINRFRSPSETKIRKYRIEITKHLQKLRWIRTKIVRLYLLFKKHPTPALKTHLIQLRRQRHELKVVIRLLIVKLHKLGVKGNLISLFYE